MNRFDVFMVDRSIKDESSLVEDPRRARRVWFFMLPWMFIGIAACMFLIWNSETRLEMAAGIFLSAVVARGAMATMRRAQAYRNGWLDGRRAMVSSLAEAKRRGLDAEEWARLEYERDVTVMSR